MSIHTIPISEAKARLSEVVAESDSHDVTLLKRGTPAAVVSSAARFEALLEKMEDMDDRLSVFERDGVTMDFDKLASELGM
jgi:antitoxin StbD